MILITGSKGMVGMNLKEILNREDCYFADRLDANLTNLIETEILFEKVKPDIVIHLAAKVGGLFYNKENNNEMYLVNTEINKNVLACCEKYKIKRLINCLSTCIFGNKCRYPLTSDQIFDCEPDSSNYGYSISKRELLLNSEQLSCEVINLIPTNMYGKYDHSTHVIPELYTKITKAKENNTDVYLPGTGQAKRIFIIAQDFCQIINICIDKELKQSKNKLIVSSNEEITIEQLAKSIAIKLNFDGKIIFDGDIKKDGQLLKTTNSKELNDFLKS